MTAQPAQRPALHQNKTAKGGSNGYCTHARKPRRCNCGCFRISLKLFARPLIRSVDFSDGHSPLRRRCAAHRPSRLRSDLAALAARCNSALTICKQYSSVYRKKTPASLSCPVGAAAGETHRLLSAKPRQSKTTRQRGLDSRFIHDAKSAARRECSRADLRKARGC